MRWILPSLAVAVVTTGASGRAETTDVFILANGGRVVGELLNPDEVPRQTYIVKTSDGVQISLSPRQVKQRKRVRPEAIEYEKVRPRYPDTVEGQWALAEWCREKTLLTERKVHLERILQLDPDHSDARRILQYTMEDGEWKTHKQIMEEQGMVYYKGQYRLPQQVALMKEKEKTESAQGEWAKKLGMWRKWLGTPRRDQEARRNILSINDPYAVPALAKALVDDFRANDPRSDEVRILYVGSLARIGTPAAKKVLADAAVGDPVPEVRLTCLDYLKEEKNPEAVAYFISKLGSKNNNEINLAAAALHRMDDPSAVAPLINALVTMHTYVAQPRNPGQYSATFPTGGGGPAGLSFGGKPKVYSLPRQNQAVLDRRESRLQRAPLEELVRQPETNRRRQRPTRLTLAPPDQGRKAR
ncbi:MAG: HEAT repeat domain-containing protein [Planctomycetota bacterium]|jgi:hypothetical protein